MTGQCRALALQWAEVAGVEPPHPTSGSMRAWAEDAAPQIDLAERKLNEAEDRVGAHSDDDKRHAIDELRRAVAWALDMHDAPRAHQPSNRVRVAARNARRRRLEVRGA